MADTSFNPVSNESHDVFKRIPLAAEKTSGGVRIGRPDGDPNDDLLLYP
jgi:hypothetical protein